MRPALILAAALALAGTAAAQDYAEFHWTGLPANINSEFGREIDRLFMLIFWVVAVMFVLTEGGLIYFAIRYRDRPGAKAVPVHGSRTVEIVWSAIPGALLFSLAMLQSSTWAKARMNFPAGADVHRVQVYPEQFTWYFRYPGGDGRFATEDDIYSGQIHIPLRRKVVLDMSSRDVIHSLFIPHARVKMDVVPGVLTKLWFGVDKTAVWDLKARKAVFATPEQLEGMVVAIDPDSEWYLFRDRKLNATGVREYWYEARPGVERVMALRNGKLEGRWAEKREGRRRFAVLEGGVPVSEVTHVLYPIDVVCAELCGFGHYTMRTTMYVHTEESLRQWQRKREIVGADFEQRKRFRQQWDAHHPAFNEP